jgi:hypothetical protein
MPSRASARPRKLPSGKYQIRWTAIGGDRPKATFDSKEEANRELKRKRIEIEDMLAGLKPLPPPEKTFGDLCDYWLKSVAPQKRSEKHDQSIIRAHLRPFFGPMRLCDIGQETARRFRTSREKPDDKTVHNHLPLLISMLNVAGPDELGWLTKVPRIKKPKNDFVRVAMDGESSVACAMRLSGELSCWSDDDVDPEIAGTVLRDFAVDPVVCGIDSSGLPRCFGTTGTNVTGEPGVTYSAISAGGVSTCFQRSIDQTWLCYGVTLDPNLRRCPTSATPGALRELAFGSSTPAASIWRADSPAGTSMARPQVERTCRPIFETAGLACRTSEQRHGDGQWPPRF